MRWKAAGYRDCSHLNGGPYTWWAWRPVVARNNLSDRVWVWREYVKCIRVPYTYNNAYGGVGKGYKYIYEVMDHQPATLTNTF